MGKVDGWAKLECSGCAMMGIAAAVLLIALDTRACAGYREGKVAYERGDYTTVLYNLYTR